MHSRTILSGIALSLMLIGQCAFAQVGAPGGGVPIGTIQFSGAPGTSLSSIPITIAPLNGAAIDSLSNCQLVGTDGVPLSGVLSGIQNGSNIFSLTTPYSFTSTSPVTATVICNEAAAALSGGDFQVNALAAPITTVAPVPVVAPVTTAAPAAAAATVAAASVAPAIAPAPTSPLLVNATVPPVIPQGTDQAIAGILTLDARNIPTPLEVRAIPLAISGASSAFVSSCSVTDVSQAQTLEVAKPEWAGNAGSLLLPTPFTIPPGQQSTLVVRCDFSSSMEIGSSFQLAFPAQQFAVTTTAGAAVSVAQGATITGAQGTNVGTATIVTPKEVPTALTTTTVAAYITPGVPSTGEGGDAKTTFALLVGSSILALISSVYALTQLRAMRREE